MFEADNLILEKRKVEALESIAESLNFLCRVVYESDEGGTYIRTKVVNNG
jgi:hypothetical protein